MYSMRALAKSAVTSEVVEGRMSVPEAAAVFGWLDRQPPVPLTNPSTCLSPYSVGADDLDAARSGEDLLCLQVLAHAAAPGRSAPTRLAEIRAEFRRTCAAPGGAVLPSVSERDCREFLARARVAAPALRGGTSGAPVTVDIAGLRLVARAGE